MNYDIGQPNPKQLQFLKSRTKYTAYGGARGGGKSWILRRKAALMALGYKGIKILIIRRTYPELIQNHVQPMLEDMHELVKGGAIQYKQTENTMHFATGSKVYFGYLQNLNDLLRYQGQEYDIIMLDEATQFTEEMFVKLNACLRGANDFPKRFYLTCNPGGIGHAWFKRLFVDRKYRENEIPEEYLFIQANVYDNTAMLEKDPDYVKQLENLPPDIRRAWLEGSWDVFEGQFFPEFSTATHVYHDRLLPAHWRRYFAMDYGLDMLAGYWAAMDEKGDCWVYREVFKPNQLMSEAAQLIKTMGAGDPVQGSFAPPDLWNRRQDTGRSVADAFAECGVYLVKVSNDRTTGWAELKEWLRLREDGTPKLHISDSCQHLIESIPMLLHSDKDPNDCANEPHEFTHAPDAIRYLLCGRPAPAFAPAVSEAVEEIEQEWQHQVNAFLEFGM